MNPGRARWGVLAAVATTAALVAWWLADEPGVAAEAAVGTATQALQAPVRGRAAPPGSAPTGAPLSPTGLAQRREQLALWQGRLQRAQHTLDAYRTAARYPHGSRPIEEHPDQVHPFAPIAEDRALRMPGGSASQGLHLRTTQERVFASGNESSRITLTLQDDAGRTLPLAVTRAVQQEVTAPGSPPSTAAYAMPANDAGVQGDGVAGDGIITAVMQPATQGFGNFAGTVRLELSLEYDGQPGYIYFDLVYSPGQAATWLPGVRETLTNGSLELFLSAQVQQPGRYVVTGRVDDAAGKPIALVQFNDEVAAGVAEFRLPLFGKLLLDARARFPLVLRDVEAYLLKPDVFPDRIMLPRRAGAVHRTGVYALASFSNAEWDSEERQRYLKELGKDVAEAEEKVRQLGP